MRGINLGLRLAENSYRERSCAVLITRRRPL